MVMMSTIAQTRRVLYVEGEDFKILRRFARRLGLSELGTGVVSHHFLLEVSLQSNRSKRLLWECRSQLGDQ